MDMTSADQFVAVPLQVAGQAAEDMPTQVAALCWRMRKGEVQVLLITSRDTGRWVIPKGWPIAGLTTAAAAAREAWEEAGVEGRVHETSIGTFIYDKLARMEVTVRCTVAVHALRVRNLKSRFPEAGERRRDWFAARDAADLVAEPALQNILRCIHQTPALLRKPV